MFPYSGQVPGWVWCPTNSASSADCPKQNIRLRLVAQQGQAVAGTKRSKNLWTDEQWKAKGATIPCFIREIRQEYMRTIWPCGYSHVCSIYVEHWVFLTPGLKFSACVQMRWWQVNTVALFLSTGFLKLILLLLHAVVWLPLLHPSLKGNYAWSWIA